ncbi:MAG TPA: response regulator [Desulfuromonadales bacterium]|nr:response regulator [Desulfuromonadales bacterium]
MDNFAHLYGMLESALKQAGKETGQLLGQELSIELSDSLETSKTSFFSGLENGCFVLGVDSSEPFAGQFYLVFSLPDAIVMSSILLGFPPGRIQEKRRLSIMENDDFDAFSEIANMVNGAFNNVFQSRLPDKIRLKLLPPKKYVPEVDTLSAEEPLPDGEYLMFRSRMEMPGQDLANLDVLIPVDLGKLYDPPPCVAPEDEAAHTVGTTAAGHATNSSEHEVTGSAPDANDGEDSIVILEDDSDQRQQMIEILEFTGLQIAEGTLDADIKELFKGRNVRLVIIGSQDADDRELAICIKVNAVRMAVPPPIIMSAERWTRTAVLKALKYGASDIIIKPCNSEDIVSKVRRHCKLAAS